MSDVEQRASELIARLCLDHYQNKLPKRGKPQAGGQEWTLMGAVVMETGRLMVPHAMRSLAHCQIVCQISITFSIISSSRVPQGTPILRRKPQDMNSL